MRSTGSFDVITQTRLQLKIRFVLAGLITAAITASANAASHRYFEIRPSAASPFKTLHTFSYANGSADGGLPEGGVVEDRAGALYGTTVEGGTHGWGTVFKLTPSGTGYIFKSIYSFTNGADGSEPEGGLLLDAAGGIYGTASLGGTANYGTVFKLTPSGSRYAESTLYSFTGGANDGSYPLAGLVADAQGSLYGTTSFTEAFGGCPGGYVPNCGAVFRLTPTATGYRESILHAFTNENGDGADPFDRLLLYKGVLYGTTQGGGVEGAGTVFATVPGSGATSILSSFGVSQGSGSYPFAAVSVGPNGALLGGTAQGGMTQGGTTGDGVVFSLSRSGLGYIETPLYSFPFPNPYAEGPFTNVVAEGSTIYGTTISGGTGPCQNGDGPQGCGTVFALKRVAGRYVDQLLYSFQNGSDGSRPQGDIIIDSQREMLFGTTTASGDGLGTVYAMKL